LGIVLYYFLTNFSLDFFVKIMYNSSVGCCDTVSKLKPLQGFYWDSIKWSAVAEPPPK
jgi:hypothetical protein